MQVGLMRSKKNMGLENTAKRLNIDYVNRVVRKHTSMTLSELINDQKMEYARTQLIMTDMPIKEISRNCGFSSLAHFYKIFKKHYAYTPKEYRRFTQMII